MIKFEDKLDDLIDQARTKLIILIEMYGVDSDFTNKDVMIITDTDFMFNLDGARYLIELSEDELIDDKGYSYSHSVLEVTKYLTLIDHLIEKYDGI